MGFFYKAGAAAGVTVVEGASYDALATSAKTQAHDTLMLDTSTGFYYKNWKTNGPGIPIPVQYFDDVTDYFSNGTGDYCFMTLDDDEDTDSDLTNRGWFVTATLGATVSKTSGNPLIVNTPAVTGAKGTFDFQKINSTTPLKYLVLCKIRSYSASGSRYSFGPLINYRLRTSDGIVHRFYNAFANTNSNGELGVIDYGSGGAVGIGDFVPFTSGWILGVHDVTNADRLTICQDLSQSRISAAPRSDSASATSTTSFISVGAVASNAGFTSGIQVDEMHCLDMTA